MRSAPVLVERDAELRVLERALEAVDTDCHARSGCSASPGSARRVF